MNDPVRDILAAYPQIYHACHIQHPRRRTNVASLSARESWILGHLDLTHPMSAGALAKHLSLRPSTVSEAIKRLEKLGYVTRRAVDHDRRRQELFLTARGAQAMKAGSVLDADRVALLLEQLPVAERGPAVRGLGLLAKAARALNAAQPKRWSPGGAS
jgi:DNA-binding MarR family transcriptional regulator